MSRLVHFLAFLALASILFAPGGSAFAQGSLADEVTEIRLDNGLRIFVLERDLAHTIRWLIQIPKKQ